MCGVSKASVPMPPAAPRITSSVSVATSGGTSRGALGRDEVTRGRRHRAEEGEHGEPGCGTAAGLGHEKCADDADEDQRHAPEARLLAPEEPGAEQHEERCGLGDGDEIGDGDEAQAQREADIGDDLEQAARPPASR